MGFTLAAASLRLSSSPAEDMKVDSKRRHLWVHELYLNSDFSLQNNRAKKEKKNEYINYMPDKYFTIIFTLMIVPN